MPEIFATEPSRGEEQECIGELERPVGRLTLEVDWGEAVAIIADQRLTVQVFFMRL